MKLYYTGAKNNNKEEQKQAIYSLGNYVSASPIPNEVSGNLFSDISLLTIDRKTKSVIGIALKNTLGEDIEDVELWFVFPEDNQATFEVAAVTLSVDSSGNYYMESIGNQQESPLHASFHTASGKTNKVNLGDLEDGKYIGLWIKRLINDDIKDDYTCAKLNEEFIAKKEKETSEEIQIKIDWSTAGSSSNSGSL